MLYFNNYLRQLFSYRALKRSMRCVCQHLLPNMWLNVKQIETKLHLIFFVPSLLISLECPEGYFGYNCSEVCQAPSYGLKCALKCGCSLCHHIYGCLPTIGIQGIQMCFTGKTS